MQFGRPALGRGSLAATVALTGLVVACGGDPADGVNANANANNANANANANNANANDNTNTNDQPLCGDGVAEPPEECDGADLGGLTCSGLGYAGGILACNSDCALDDSGCTLPLGDPAVYRAADDADVCASGPPAADCGPGDMAFVAAEYGTTLTRADDAVGTLTTYRLVAMVERLGPSNIDVFVLGPDGAPLPNLPVAFYWPTAPDPSRPDEWYPNKVTGVTGADGRAGFAITADAYLPCCGCGGPHAIWVSEPGGAPDTTVASDLVDRLGMVGGTNHRHLDLMFQRVDPPPAPAPVDAVRCPLQI